MPLPGVVGAEGCADHSRGLTADVTTLPTERHAIMRKLTLVALALALTAPAGASAASWTDSKKPKASWTDSSPTASWTDAKAQRSLRTTR